MPLHLLGKKSWNVYNADNIARVKADEAAAAARKAAEEQRIQEIDAARRAAILRGETPPPLPEENPPHKDETSRPVRRDGHDKKRRRLAGEDDTDRDIRLAASAEGDGGDELGDIDARLVRLRKPTSDAPLIDHAGNINLFPVDIKEQMKRERNEEVEKEKRKKEKALEDQHTMRFSNAAGRGGLGQQPWYASRSCRTAEQDEPISKALTFPDLENKNVWGNEDPLRKKREESRITSNDPFTFMQRAQVQLKMSKEGKKKWAAERDRELMELRAAQERSSCRENHDKKKKRAHKDDDRKDRGARNKERSSLHKHQPMGRSRSRERSYEHSSSHRRTERRQSLSREEERRPRDQTGSTNRRRERRTSDRG
ncbi:uncharacterized protein CC84DRAFT_1206777 [Paraphaeosphaeria sporulosa]|uniref:CBF1-interacting co-repressor CIR N-terminal domain-containing protein n=1 Tax=Paraphaeosphaeria sporulosa TaxID=1460663 RepID=A0A177C9J0_9PLEO|nr:uncharacterized protein CC84DRAFT_1206777 [Paraphaeosphaeria sporulosa]OAG03390.1 hypothetical protein CC84DRAFT_1206777 [Paraphaeosphaeria sporulosa]